MAIKKYQAVNVATLVFSAILVGVSIATIVLAGHADQILRKYYPAGPYAWPDWRDPAAHPLFTIRVLYNRSSEIKTLVSSSLGLLAGLIGIVAFGLSYKRPSARWLSAIFLLSAVTTCIVSIVSVATSVAEEGKINRDTCWMPNGPVAETEYTCTVEHSACSMLRFTIQYDQLVRMPQLDTACIGFHYGRYMMIPLAVVSLILTVLYAAKVWIGKASETEEERADTRVRTLQEDE